jgi:hypothetical protein
VRPRSGSIAGGRFVDHIGGFRNHAAPTLPSEKTTRSRWSAIGLDSTTFTVWNGMTRLLPRLNGSSRLHHAKWPIVQQFAGPHRCQNPFADDFSTSRRQAAANNLARAMANKA